MAELYNLLVVERVGVAEVAEHLTRILGARGHSPAEGSHAGARSLTLQVAQPDLVVVDLVDWEEVDLALAKSLSASLAASVSVAHLDGAGETEAFVTFTAGKKTKPGASTARRFASDAGVDSLVLLGAPVSLSFIAPMDGAASATEALVRANVLPILRAAGFARTKVDVRYHPRIDGVIAYARKVDEARIVVRYDYAKGDALAFGSQTVLIERRGEISQVGEIRCGVEAHWRDDASFVARDFEMFAAKLVRDLEVALPAAEAQKLQPFAAVRARFDDLHAHRLVARVIESGWSKGEVVFRGDRLLTLAAGGRRFTFRLATSALPATGEVAAGDIVELRGGDVRARALRVGAAVVVFDELGNIVGPAPTC